MNTVFTDRKSFYALSGESIDQATLNILLDAARWAPSSYNNQPTRFIYAHRNTPAWQKLFDLMVPFNQSWAKNAAVLLLVISKKTMGPKNSPSTTHSLEAGAAWMSLALQATMIGLVTHAMAGFDYEKARTDLAIPENFAIEMMGAIGKLALHDAEAAFIERDKLPRTRKQINEIASEGSFNFNE